MDPVTRASRARPDWIWEQIQRRLWVYGAFTVTCAVGLLIARPPHAELWLLAVIALPLMDRQFRQETWRLLLGAQGERTMSRLLAPLEAEGFVVEHNIAFGGGNIDFVVIGPHAVLAIDAKAWRGRVYLAKGPRLMVNGGDRSKAIKQARSEAMEVKKRLARGGITTFVEAVVALTHTRLKKGPMTLSGVHVLDADAVATFIRAGSSAPTIDVEAARALVLRAAPPRTEDPAV